MRGEKKSINVTFRVSPQFKKIIDDLVEDSESASTSAYFYKMLSNEIEELVPKKARLVGRDQAAKEFGLSDNIRAAIQSTDDIKGLFGSEENERKFKVAWNRAAMEAERKIWQEYGFNFDDETLFEGGGIFGGMLEQDEIFKDSFLRKNKLEEKDGSL